MDSHDVLAISQVVERSGFAASALRYYESQGLIAATRSGGGQRRYERSVLRRLAFIRAASNVGLTLEEIRDELDRLPSGRTPTRADWQRITRHWRSRLDEQIAALRETAGRAGLLYRVRLPVAEALRHLQPARRRCRFDGRARRRLPTVGAPPTAPALTRGLLVRQSTASGASAPPAAWKPSR